MEALVIIDPEKIDDAANDVFGKVRKSQEFSDRLFVVEGDTQALNALGEQPGVTLSDGISPGDTQLSLTERLSLEAWQKNRGAHKSRLGDGLGWGHKDFQAPKAFPSPK